LILLSDENNNTVAVYLVYFTLLHASAVHISIHQAGHGYTKGVKGRDLCLQTAGKKIIK
jgi:hypothetical protein